MSNIIHLVSNGSPESQGGIIPKQPDTSWVSQEFNFKVNIDVSTHFDEVQKTITRLEEQNIELNSKNIALLTQCEVLKLLEEKQQKIIETLQWVVEKQAKDILSFSEENEALLLNYWVIDVSRDGTIFAMNERMEKISWYSIEEVRWRNMSTMSSGTHNKDFWNSVFEVIHAWLQWRWDIRNKKKDGTFQWLETIIFPMTDSRGFTFFRLARRDISEIQENNMKLRSLLANEIDPTTGLPTTRRMEKDYANKSPKRLTLLHINDMDGIKAKHGIAVWDKILQKIAKVLTKYAIGNPELGIGIYRWWLSDFAIVYNSNIKNEFAQEQYVKLQNITLRNFGSTHPNPKFTFCPTFSYGISITESDIYRSLLNAESALNKIKDQSNGVRIYDESTDKLMLPWTKKDMKDDITYAFENDGFILHFQPIVKVNHYGKMGEFFWKLKKRWFPKNETDNLKYEILVRMRDKNNPDQLIPPLDFLKILEDEGKNMQLTTRVIDLACKFMLQNPGNYSVNFTKDDLYKVGRAEEIINQLKSYWINPTRFTWEILENIDILTPTAKENIDFFQKQWCKISIDDFGTGNSTLERYVEINANFLKLDKKFIRWIENKPKYQWIVKVTLKLARSEDNQVVAEWVETEAEKQMVIDLWVDYIQGYIDNGKPKDHI